MAEAVCEFTNDLLIGHDLFDFLDASASLLGIVDRLHAHTVALQTSLILTK